LPVNTTGVIKNLSLATNLLLLREVNELDWMPARKYASDPEVVGYMTKEPNTQEETRSLNLLRIISVHRSASEANPSWSRNNHQHN